MHSSGCSIDSVATVGCNSISAVVFDCCSTVVVVDGYSSTAAILRLQYAAGLWLQYPCCRYISMAAILQL